MCARFTSRLCTRLCITCGYQDWICEKAFDSEPISICGAMRHESERANGADK